VPKKQRKKIKSQSRHSKRQERKKIKKKRPITSACDGLTRVRQWLIPAFEMAGMGKTTKKNPKNESGSFWKFFFKGGQT